jgi:hypothetical protein
MCLSCLGWGGEMPGLASASFAALCVLGPGVWPCFLFSDTQHGP